jgi:hypothetical protein
VLADDPETLETVWLPRPIQPILPTHFLPGDGTAVFPVDHIRTISFTLPTRRYRVHLTSPAGTLSWSPARPRDNLILGRSDFCSLTIKRDIVSRIHGYVAVIDRGCVYIDQSSNGSWVLVENRLTHLIKAGVALMGRGTLVLGVDPAVETPDPALVVEFDVAVE